MSKKNLILTIGASALAMIVLVVLLVRGWQKSSNTDDVPNDSGWQQDSADATDDKAQPYDSASDAGDVQSEEIPVIDPPAETDDRGGATPF